MISKRAIEFQKDVLYGVATTSPVPFEAFVDNARKVKSHYQKPSNLGNCYSPFVSIRPDYLSLYYRPEDSHSSRSSIDLLPKNELSLLNLKSNDTEGFISKKASKAITTAISWLNHLSKNQKVWDEKQCRYIKFKLNFATLTLPSPQIRGYCDNYGNYYECDNAQMYISEVRAERGVFDFHYSDRFIKSELLNHFLIILRRECGVRNYIWRAETQQNGNIHFHITMNKFIHYEKLRDAWLQVLKKTDFIDRYQQKHSAMSFEQYYKIYHTNVKLTKEILLQRYNKGMLSNWQLPNVTDIHAVYKIKNLPAYLCEYMSKNNHNYRAIEGNLWRSSECLSKLKACIIEVKEDIRKEIDILFSNFRNRIKFFDYASIFLFSVSDLKFMLPKSKLVEEFVRYKFNQLQTIRY